MDSENGNNRKGQNNIVSYKSYPGSSRKKIIKTILEDDKIQQIIKRVAKRNNKPAFLIQRNAKKILKEIAADLTPFSIRTGYRLFKHLWKRMYSRLYVDIPSFENVKPILQKYPVVLIPSHKSHADYLLLSSIFYEHGLVPPFIAAGVNMAFWPFGYIFRKMGAFYIRRGIGNDLLYFKLLFKYMSILVKENGTQEFFIEGGRSKNGKLQKPQLGLLTLQIDAFLQEDLEDLYFVPISIAYDRVLEENAYYKEITVGRKSKESLFEVIKSIGTLKSNHGNAHVCFGEPISIKKHISKYTSGKLTPKLKKTMIKDLGRSIIKEINSLSHITTTSLVALSLLSSKDNPISHKNLIETAMFYLSYLKHRGVNISHTLEADEKSIISGITLLLEAEFIEAFTKDEVKFYKFRSRNRISLDYYKNNIIHSCIPLLYTMISLEKETSKIIELDKIRSDFDYLLNLFENEFILKREEEEAALKSTLDWLSTQNVISLKEDDSGTKITIKEESMIGTIASALKNFLEAFHVAAKGLDDIITGEITMSDTGLNTTLLEVGLRMLRKDEITMREAVTTPYLNSAVKYLHKKGIHHVDSLLQTKDLEDEDEITSTDQDQISGKREHEKLNNFISDLKKFL